MTRRPADILMRMLSPGGPIRQPRAAEGVPRFIGRIAEPKEQPCELRDFQNPFLAPEGRNGMHGDSHNTEAYAYPGPLGRAPVVRSRALGFVGGEAATVMFDSKGRVMCVSGGFTGFRLLLMDPDSLEILAETRLPQRASTRKFLRTLDFSHISHDTSGGAYCHLLAGDRPIIGAADNTIRVSRVDERAGRPVWPLEKSWNVAPHLPRGSYIQDAEPDYDGNVWFVTRMGQVGFVDPDGQVRVRTIPGEEIHNTVAVSDEGVFFNTDRAQYLYRAVGGAPQEVWRTGYDRGSAVKPGSILRGSGTTPTLLDVRRADGTTAKLAAIADNADERINVVVFDRETGRVISRTPVFDRGCSATENSLIAFDRSFIVENNYSPGGAAFLTRDPRSHPGVARVEMNADVTDARVVWESREASPSTVPKMSAKNGLVYLYTREFGGGIPDGTVAWYLTAIDYETGETVFKIFTGVGRRWNNSYAPITLGPNGKAYVGVFGGLICVGDGE